MLQKSKKIQKSKSAQSVSQNSNSSKQASEDEKFKHSQTKEIIQNEGIISENNISLEEHKSIFLSQQIDELKQIDHKDVDFICSICLNYIVLAVSTRCGHSFCEQCLNEYLLCVKNCPVCPTDLRKAKSSSNTLLDEIIFEYIRYNHLEELEFYNQRVKETKEWRINKQYSYLDVEVGSKIDVRDPSYIWKVAIVKRIKVASETRSRCFVVHYEGWSEQFDEEIPESSPRLATYQFYTSRSDIPQYDMKTKNPFLKRKLIIRGFESSLSNKKQDKCLYFDDNSSSNENQIDQIEKQ